jgi:hypothetical protein
VKAHPRVLTGLVVLATAVLATVAATVATAAGPSINAAAQAGTVWQRGQQNAAGHAKHTTSPNLTYHGGPVMHGTTAVHPIFWGTSWQSYNGDEISGIVGFYQDVGDSSTSTRTPSTPTRRATSRRPSREAP